MDHVLDSSLTNQFVCSSKNTAHIVGKLVAVEMIVYHNFEGLLTQRYQCIIHLASGNTTLTLRSIAYLIDKSTKKKKEKVKHFW